MLAFEVSWDPAIRGILENEGIYLELINPIGDTRTPPP